MVIYYIYMFRTISKQQFPIAGIIISPWANYYGVLTYFDLRNHVNQVNQVPHSFVLLLLEIQTF